MKDREEAHCIHLIFRVELSFKDLYLPMLSSKLASFENKRQKRRKNVEIFINSQLFFLNLNRNHVVSSHFIHFYVCFLNTVFFFNTVLHENFPNSLHVG